MNWRRTRRIASRAAFLWQALFLSRGRADVGLRRGELQGRAFMTLALCRLWKVLKASVCIRSASSGTFRSRGILDPVAFFIVGHSGFLRLRVDSYNVFVRAEREAYVDMALERLLFSVNEYLTSLTSGSSARRYRLWSIPSEAPPEDPPWWSPIIPGLKFRKRSCPAPSRSEGACLRGRRCQRVGDDRFHCLSYLRLRGLFYLSPVCLEVQPLLVLKNRFFSGAVMVFEGCLGASLISSPRSK